MAHRIARQTGTGGIALKQVRTRGKQLRPLLDAVKWVLLWITVALAAAAMIWSALGQELALQFLGGYLIELSLSMDNLFVFMSIFTAFGIAEHARHRVLHWGILGAVVLRLLFILLGSAIIGRFAWVLYLFGALLVVNGAEMFMGEEAEKDVKRSPSDDSDSARASDDRFVPGRKVLCAGAPAKRPAHGAAGNASSWCSAADRVFRYYFCH